MTDSSKSHITLVVDRTGSMENIRTDAEGAVRAFIREQKKDPHSCTVLLADFDDMEPFRTVFDGELPSCPEYSLIPRGSTPLLDAIGKGITLTGERLNAMPEGERPGHVFFVVETDGFENASKDWTKDAVVALIKQQEDQYHWTFVFLGAGKDAWNASRIFAGTTMHTNSVHSTQDAGSYVMANSYVSGNIAKVRSGAKQEHEIAWAADISDAGEVDDSVER